MASSSKAATTAAAEPLLLRKCTLCRKEIPTTLFFLCIQRALKSARNSLREKLISEGKLGEGSELPIVKGRKKRKKQAICAECKSVLNGGQAQRMEELRRNSSTAIAMEVEEGSTTEEHAPRRRDSSGRGAKSYCLLL